MQLTNNSLTNSFHLLISTVRDFEAIGRPCLGATLKPRLYARGFDEKLFGFRKFGDFLRAAAAAGNVRLSPTPGGDISISLPSAPVTQLVAPATAAPLPLSPPTSASEPNPMGPVKVRQDLWNAFNSFSDRWLYDRVQDRAFKEMTDGAASPGTISIPPGGERIKEWMQAFTSLQELGIKARLSHVIESGVDLYQFSNAIRVNGLQRAWSQFHTQNVVAAIQAWAATNNVRPQSIVTPFQRTLSFSRLPESTNGSTTPLDASAEVVPQVQPHSAELNSKLESLIDALINELISLRGLLQVVGSKRP